MSKYKKYVGESYPDLHSMLVAASHDFCQGTEYYTKSEFLHVVCAGKKNPDDTYTLLAVSYGPFSEQYLKDWAKEQGGSFGCWLSSNEIRAKGR